MSGYHWIPFTGMLAVAFGSVLFCLFLLLSLLGFFAYLIMVVFG